MSEGRATTRGDLGRALSLRSTTVSDLVAELLEHDLVRESAAPARGRGRPAASLVFNHRRLGGIVVGVVDGTLVATGVDLSCRTLAEDSVAPPPDADNEVMADHVRRLVAGVIARFPPDTELASVVFSLSGLLDRPRSTWCFTSRWPRVRDLRVTEAVPDAGCAVELVRNLDAELAGIRLDAGRPAGEGELLLHWGRGIGASYCADGTIVNRHRGRFCEIGHWGLGDSAGRPCTCGNTDCLETVAALWALGPHLRETFPDLPLDEAGLGERLRRLDPLRCAAMEEALVQVLRLTGNLCRLLFPDRVVLTGPFVRNPAIFARFVQALERAPLLSSLDRVHVSTIEPGARHEIVGALQEPLRAALRRLIESGPRRGERGS